MDNNKSPFEILRSYTNYCDIINNNCIKYAKEYCDIYDVDLYNEIYEHKINEIIYLIENKNLLSYITQIDINNIAYLTPQELCPIHWEKIMLKQENIKNVSNSIGVSNSYTCKKCGCKKHYIHQMQKRSADEPPTVSVECIQCGRTFVLH